MTTALLHALSHRDRDRLLGLSRQVTFPEDCRIFDEGHPADRFWIIKTGTVHLRMRPEPARAPVLEMLGHGDLLGWSWLVSPFQWRLTALAFTPVRAFEFDAATVREVCDAEPSLGMALTLRVLDVVAHRLQATRARLADACAPYTTPVGGMPA